MGVRGIRLGESDRLESVFYMDASSDQAVIYKEKEIHLNRLKIAKRDGKGTKAKIPKSE